MLPKNKLSNSMISKLKVYKGSEHPHIGQKPELLKQVRYESRYYICHRKKKNSTARVYLSKGKGNILVNDIPLEDYFGREVLNIGNATFGSFKYC